MFWFCNFCVADNVEKTAEAAIEVIDSVAEATEKVADEVAQAFPGSETLKQAASKIKTIADEIEEDADKAEALIEKVSFFFYFYQIYSLPSYYCSCWYEY
jgi:methyl-accepting chemotaxis protein